MENISTAANWTPPIGSGSHSDYPADAVFYCALVPFSLLANLVCVDIVRRLLMHRRTMRRSIPDLYVGLLTFADLAAILFVHLLTLISLATPWNRLPKVLCYYQGFAVSVYLKLEFLLQVAIAADRFFALLRPLHYRAYSSRRLVNLTAAIIVFYSLTTTSLEFALGSRDLVAVELDTAVVGNSTDTLTNGWPSCHLSPRFSTVSDMVMGSINAFIFIIGFFIFSGCNCAIVHVLWTYHAKREITLLKELSDAMRNSKTSRSCDKSSTDTAKSRPPTTNRTSSKVGQTGTGSPMLTTQTNPTVTSETKTSPSNSQRRKRGGVIFNDARRSRPTHATIREDDDSAMIFPRRYRVTEGGDLELVKRSEADVRPVEEPSEPLYLSAVSILVPEDSLKRKSTPSPTSKYDPDEVFLFGRDLKPLDRECDLNVNGEIVKDLDVPRIPKIPIITFQTVEHPTKKDEKKSSTKVKVDVRRLLKGVVKGMKKQKKEILLAKMVLLCSILFIVTWLPYATVITLELCKVTVHHRYVDLSLKIIFLNAFLNPIFHAICRGNYRNGFTYVLKVSLHHSFWCFIKRPPDTKLFREPPQRRRKRERAQQSMARKLHRKEKQQENIKRHKEKIRRLEQNEAKMKQEEQDNSYAMAKLKAEAVVLGKKHCYYRVHKEFSPSNHLQSLFDRCLQEESSETSQDENSSTSFDYDALLADDGQVYMHLKNIWDITSAMYHINSDDSDSSTHLDVDYDKLGGLLDAAENNMNLKRPSLLETSAVIRKSLRSSTNIAFI